MLQNWIRSILSIAADEPVARSAPAASVVAPTATSSSSSSVGHSADPVDSTPATPLVQALEASLQQPAAHARQASGESDSSFELLAEGTADSPSHHRSSSRSSTSAFELIEARDAAAATPSAAFSLLSPSPSHSASSHSITPASSLSLSLTPLPSPALSRLHSFSTAVVDASSSLHIPSSLAASSHSFSLTSLPLSPVVTGTALLTDEISPAAVEEDSVEESKYPEITSTSAPSPLPLTESNLNAFVEAMDAAALEAERQRQFDEMSAQIVWEEDEEDEEYDQDDDFGGYGYCDCDFAIADRSSQLTIRQRHRPQFGDRITRKSQQTRKQTRLENAVELNRIRTVKAELKSQRQQAAVAAAVKKQTAEHPSSKLTPHQLSKQKSKQHQQASLKPTHIFSLDSRSTSRRAEKKISPENMLFTLPSKWSVLRDAFVAKYEPLLRKKFETPLLEILDVEIARGEKEAEHEPLMSIHPTHLAHGYKRAHRPFSTAALLPSTLIPVLSRQNSCFYSKQYRLEQGWNQPTMEELNRHTPESCARECSGAREEGRSQNNKSQYNLLAARKFISNTIPSVKTIETEDHAAHAIRSQDHCTVLVQAYVADTREIPKSQYWFGRLYNKSSRLWTAGLKRPEEYFRHGELVTMMKIQYRRREPEFATLGKQGSKQIQRKAMERTYEKITRRDSALALETASSALPSSLRPTSHKLLTRTRISSRSLKHSSADHQPFTAEQQGLAACGSYLTAFEARQEAADLRSQEEARQEEQAWLDCHRDLQVRQIQDAIEASGFSLGEHEARLLLGELDQKGQKMLRTRLHDGLLIHASLFHRTAAMFDRAEVYTCDSLRPLQQVMTVVSKQVTKVRHREALGYGKGGKRTRKEMKAMRTIYNERRKQLKQELSKNAPKLEGFETVQPITTSPIAADSPAGRHAAAKAAKQAKKSHRAAVKQSQQSTHKPRMNRAPHEKSSSSTPHPPLPANAFENRKLKKNKPISARQLIDEIRSRAIEVEAGTARLGVSHARAPLPKPYRASQRSYFGLAPGLSYGPRPLPFAINMKMDLLAFQYAFYALFRSEIEQALHSVPAGSRILSIRPFDFTASKERYSDQCESYPKRFLVALMRRLNDRVSGSGNPLATELDLRFSQPRSCVYAQPPDEMRAMDEFRSAGKLRREQCRCPRTAETIRNERAAEYQYHSAAQCLVQCQFPLDRAAIAAGGGIVTYRTKDLPFMRRLDRGPQTITVADGSLQQKRSRTLIVSAVIDGDQARDQPILPYQPSRKYHRGFRCWLRHKANVRNWLKSRPGQPAPQPPHRQEVRDAATMLPCFTIEYELLESSSSISPSQLSMNSIQREVKRASESKLSVIRPRSTASRIQSRSRCFERAIKTASAHPSNSNLSSIADESANSWEMGDMRQCQLAAAAADAAEVAAVQSDSAAGNCSSIQSEREVSGGGPAAEEDPAVAVAEAIHDAHSYASTEEEEEESNEYWQDRDEEFAVAEDEAEAACYDGYDHADLLASEFDAPLLRPSKRPSVTALIRPDDHVNTGDRFLRHWSRNWMVKNLRINKQAPRFRNYAVKPKSERFMEVQRARGTRSSAATAIDG